MKNKVKNRPGRALPGGAIIKYCLLCLLVSALVTAAGFITTAVRPRLAFPAQSLKPSAENSSGTEPSEFMQAAMHTYSPDELASVRNATGSANDRVNILFMGIDDYGDRKKAGYRTGSILLLSADFSGKRVDIISIPSESYADTGDRTGSRIDSIFITAEDEQLGFENLKETARRVLGGIPINYYAAIDMEGVKKIIDSIGGIFFDVICETDIGGRHLDRGFQLLNGSEALEYCRAVRVSSSAEYEDGARQQRLIAAVFSKLKKSKSLPEILTIYNSIRPYILTDLGIDQTAAVSFFLLNADPVKGYGYYSLKGEYVRTEGSLCYVLDHRFTRQLISDVFGIEPEIDWEYSLGYIKDTALR